MFCPSKMCRRTVFTPVPNQPWYWQKFKTNHGPFLDLKGNGGGGGRGWNLRIVYNLFQDEAIQLPSEAWISPCCSHSIISIWACDIPTPPNPPQNPAQKYDHYQ
ncbi:Hypothetical predicted protein [Podarcis lilfordi]|uniref:Uncharacterized protein n=1 Tax=Podarcis lilfordi TaxID=74358 RepID=A0AA35KD50_9SAUR|nr:Hypothetical predicted protein [Podarcis lilfordi]